MSALNNSMVLLTEGDIEGTVENMSYEYDETKFLIAAKVFIELHTVLALFNLIADVFIVFVIVKYRRLHLDKSNKIILNITVLDALFTILTPITIRYYEYYFWYTTVCVVTETNITLLLGNIILMTLLTLHWYINLYHSNLIIKLNSRLDLFFICLYVFLGFCTGLGADACFTISIGIFVKLGMVLSFGVYILLTVIINIIHFFRKKTLVENKTRKNNSYLLSNVFFLSKLPLITTILFEIFLPRAHDLAIFITLGITGFIAISNGIYFFVILYKCDTDYNTFFRHTFRGKCSRYNDEIEQPITYNDNRALDEDGC